MQFSSTTSISLGTAGNIEGITFVERSLLPYLRDAQNSDGGWGFARGLTSRVEPAAWALLALREFSAQYPCSDALVRGSRYLKSVQLPDGSWPTAAGQTHGAWATSLACWALSGEEEFESAETQRGLEWLVKGKPADSGLLWRTVRRFTTGQGAVTQDPSYFGWSWTPGTASWVEPTAYALIALRRRLARGWTTLPSGSEKRIDIAERMLRDRMCPGGGWNCGNPIVYGVAGQPQVGPTVWTLLALRGEPAQPEVRESLHWLEANGRNLLSVESMVLTEIALSAFGRSDLELRSQLRESCKTEDAVWTVPAAAWAALAFSERREWLKLPSPSEGS